MAKTIAEKILSRHAGRDLKVGDFAICEIDFCFGQDGTSGIIIDRFNQLGINKVFNKDKFAIVIDHNSPSPNQGVAAIHKKLRDFTVGVVPDVIKAEVLCQLEVFFMNFG